MMFLCYTQPAHFGYRIPGGSLLNDIPFQCVGNPLIFQIPDVGTEGSAIPASVSHVLIVTSVKSSLEGLACGACVGLLVTGVSSGHSCPVNNVAYSATYARENQACVRILSRAGAMVGFLGCCCSV